MERRGCHSFFAFTTVITMAALTAGCGLFVGKKEDIQRPAKPLRISAVSLTMAADTNENWPVLVDMVRVPDASLVDTLLGIEADAWFDGEKQRFGNANPDSRTDSWEVVPGTSVGPFGVRMRGRVAGVLFCRTRAPTPPLKLDARGNVLINVTDDGCTPSDPRSRRNSPAQGRRGR